MTRLSAGKNTGLLLLLVSTQLAWAAQYESGSSKPGFATISITAPQPAGPAVVLAAQMPELLNVRTDHLALLTYDGEKLTPIPYQIDRRDAEGRFILEDDTSTSEDDKRLEAGDEIVFMHSDAGARVVSYDMMPAGAKIHPIAVTKDARQSWVYLAQFSELHSFRSDRNYVRYERDEDLVSGKYYRLGFSKEKPFIVNRFQWRTPAGDWADNQIDTMKVRHLGKLFGIIPFKRTEADYKSRLTQVKTGPIRVIRRTQNTVHMLLGLSTPVLYIDQIASADYVEMDLIIDLPFSMGMFFDEVITLSTVDWMQAEGVGLAYADGAHVVTVDGKMSEEEWNLPSDNSDYLIRQAGGDVRVSMDIDSALPVKKELYLMDDREQPDPPENHIGQIGNSGYRTTGWEDVGRGVHHLRFSFALMPNAAIVDASDNGAFTTVGLKK